MDQKQGGLLSRSGTSRGCIFSFCAFGGVSPADPRGDTCVFLESDFGPVLRHALTPSWCAHFLSSSYQGHVSPSRACGQYWDDGVKERTTKLSTAHCIRRLSSHRVRRELAAGLERGFCPVSRLGRVERALGWSHRGRLRAGVAWQEQMKGGCHRYV